jgi:hypothetical protein
MTLELSTKGGKEIVMIDAFPIKEEKIDALLCLISIRKLIEWKKQR